MNINKIIVTATLLLASHSTFALDNAKKALIDELLTQTGQAMDKSSKQMANFYLDNMTKILKQTKPDLDPKAFVILKETIEEVMIEEFEKKGTLQGMVYPIYDKYLTTDDLKAMIAFNRSPTGKKILKVMPKIQQEAILAGSQWGQSMGPLLQEKLEKKFKENNISLK